MPAIDAPETMTHPATATNQQLEGLLQQARQLPPAPLLLLELLALLNQPDTDSDKVVKLISTNSRLSSTVLKVCSSAYFAVGGFEPDLQQAVARLGFRAIYQLVAAVTSRHIFRGMRDGNGLWANDLWRHSVTTGIAAQMVGRNIEDSESHLFTAALIHDVGKILLAEALGSDYGDLVKATGQAQRCLLEMEKEQLGVTHAELGAHLLRRWKLPPNVVAAVLHHHDPRRAEEHQRLAAFVHVGDMIAHFMGHGHGPQPFSFAARKAALEILHLSPEAIPHCITKTFEQLKVFHALLEEGG